MFCRQLLWTGLFSCLFYQLAAGRQPDYYFHHLGTGNGLSHPVVNCILRDSRGFIWIGTNDGLNRYDGHNFIVYRHQPGNPSSISGNTITALHEDRNGNLWIATADGGITRYHYRMPPNEQFRQFKHDPYDSSSIPVNNINGILGDEKYLWLATGGAALLRFNPATAEFMRPAGMGEWTFNDLCFDSQGMIWAGREGGSIVKINPRNMQWESDPRYADIYASLPHMVVTRLYRDSRHDIWFGSWDHALYRFNHARAREEAFIPGQKDGFADDEATAFYEDATGRIWIGTKNSGILVYDRGSGRFHRYVSDPGVEGSLSANQINCIYIDSEGRVWIGTNRGISLLREQYRQFRKEYLPSTSPHSAIMVYDFLRLGEFLYIATSHGLYTRDATGNYRHFPLAWRGQPLSITRIFRDVDGSIYLGTDYTLFRFDPRNATIHPFPNSEKDEVMSRLIESRITGILRDTIEGRPVLITIPYGHYLSWYDLEQQRWVSRKDTSRKILSRYQLGDNLIRRIYKTSDGMLWLANAKKGLTSLSLSGEGSTGFMNSPSRPGTISSNNIYDIREDGAGNLWISTLGGGLNYFDRRRNHFTHFPSAASLMEGIEMDSRGNIWCISNGGIQKFDISSRSFTYFPVPGIEDGNGLRGTLYRDEENRLYAGGPGYFISFLPEDIRFELDPIRIQLTDFQVFGQSFSHMLTGNIIRLSHKQNFFTIHFSAPSYAGSPVYYSYRLQGVDDGWIDAGISIAAPYTNLGAGIYNFQVRATTTPGVWPHPPATISIRIFPPFWKQWWFYMVIALIILGAAYSVYRYRINELLKRQSIRNKIAQDLHDEVGSTLSSISVYSQVARIYEQKNRQDELHSTLEKISSTSSEMIAGMSDIVWAISPKNDHMGTMIQRMESFARPLLNAQGIECSLEYDQVLTSFQLPMEIRKNFYLVFKEAVNNAVKYSRCSRLKVMVRKKHHHIVLTIRDDGIGFDARQAEAAADSSLSGNGLQNMKRRAAEMKGTLTIRSSPGNGTLIRLVFPLRRSSPFLGIGFPFRNPEIR